MDKLPVRVLELFKTWGAEGGSAKSKAKAKASRENGKKGGRPKGKQPKGTR